MKYKNLEELEINWHCLKKELNVFDFKNEFLKVTDREYILSLSKDKFQELGNYISILKEGIAKYSYH